MKKLALLACAGLALGTTACNESNRQDALDVQSSKTAIAKDNAAIAKQDENLAVNRAEKANAKARGDYARQASESVQIGTNKAVRKAKTWEKAADQQILEEDREDLRH